MEIRLLLGVGLEADTVVGDIGGEQVWWKPVFRDGKQIGYPEKGFKRLHFGCGAHDRATGNRSCTAVPLL